MNDDLAPILATLPEPQAPSSITATVMARIEREAAHQQAVAASPLHRRGSPDVLTWVTACLGIGLVGGAIASGWYTNGLPDVFAPRFFRGGLGAALAGWQALLAGIAGLALCLRALFAPLRSR
jgi:anti-sigma factor RsiW